MGKAYNYGKRSVEGNKDPITPLFFPVRWSVMQYKQRPTRTQTHAKLGGASEVCLLVEKSGVSGGGRSGVVTRHRRYICTWPCCACGCPARVGLMDDNKHCWQLAFFTSTFFVFILPHAANTEWESSDCRKEAQCSQPFNCSPGPFRLPVIVPHLLEVLAYGISLAIMMLDISRCC